MSISAEYDPLAQAGYVYLRDAAVASSVPVGEDFVVDLDADSAPVGIELLVIPATRGELGVLLMRFGLLDELDAVWNALRDVLPVRQTRSGMSVYYSFAFPDSGVVVTGASSASIEVESHEYALA